MLFSMNVPRRRRTGLVVQAPPPTMAIEQEPDPKSGDGGSSSAAAVNGSVASPSSSLPSANNGEAAVAAAAAQLESEEERLRKGKMLAVDQTPKKDDALLQPPAAPEKLMGDAIRAGVDRSHRHKPCVLTAVKDIVFDDIPVVSDTLRQILRDLGHVSPICVYQKTMSYSDRDNGQNRLLMSCKATKRKSNKHNHSHSHPKLIISGKELALVYEQEDKELKGNNKSEEHKQRPKRKRRNLDKEAENPKKEAELGLDVQAYDRNGEMYPDLKFRYLESNTAYRIIGKGWTHFLRNNNLLLVEKKGEKKRRRRKGKKSSSPSSDGSDGRQSSSPSPEPNGCGRKKQEIDNVRIELWVFRSRKLELGCTDHTDGPLGMVMLHYHEGEDGAAEHVGDEEEEPSSGSEDVMDQSEGLEDQQREAVPEPDAGEAAHEMVMDDVPASSIAEDAAEALLLLNGNIERGERLKLTTLETFALLQLN